MSNLTWEVMVRIAISGSHCVGKSTLVRKLVSRLPQFQCVEEPYAQLNQQNLAHYASGFSVEGMLEQLECSLALIKQSAPSQNLVFERCPIDFVAYMMHFAKVDGFELEDSEVAEYFLQIREAIKQLDFIVFLPLHEGKDIEYFEEDAEVREEVDLNLKQIYREDKFDFFPEYNTPRIVEVVGNLEARATQLVKIIQQHQVDKSM